MITIFCVRPRGLNVGNEAIFIGTRHLLRQAFGGLVNLVSVPSVGGGLSARTIHEMNLYGHGVVVGGGNLYENNQLDLDAHALRALRPPLMLFSLSHGRIYDHRHELVPRTDSMPDSQLAVLHERACLSLVRDDATLAHLRSIGLDTPRLGGCPTILLSQIALPRADLGPEAASGALISIRHPQLMSIPLRDQARLHATILGIMDALERDGFGPVRILCHDTRDLAFASSLGAIEYVLADDVYSHLELLRRVPLVVTFRLHAFLPCVSFGTPAINISYDERSLSLVRTLGLDAWDVDYVRSGDVVSEVRDRCARIGEGELDRLRGAAQPRWHELESTMRDAMAAFASRVRAYAAECARL
ncbi:MAG TPA: polysaccharide pyruvyl transferase family protein [Thermoanaerobaculia bacterium]|nr:polysaccharide pyruvyl transferase family protein [Thermoanaerobaculia bacterium]